MSTALSFDGVSKIYRGASRYRALRDDVMAFVGRREAKQQPEAVVKALDALSFEVPAGQSLALIGSNGSGKTTALKIASRIAYPTRGRVCIRGRVGALIEVGTGMHPELTGRENVQLYGRILGLAGREIEKRFDSIVDFAGIGGAIDQPVKQYSSGMQLRLGFSVAAHLEPDVLLVDEALAVGDASFQHRCVERMSQLVQEGRTLVFVSHDMTTVETVCKRAIVLRGGQIEFDGTGREAVQAYMRGVEAELLASGAGQIAAGEHVEITRVTLHDMRRGEQVSEVRSGEPITVRLHYRARNPIIGPQFSIGLSDPALGLFTLASMLIDGQAPQAVVGEGHVDCTFEYLPLRPRLYDVWGEIRGHNGQGPLVAWQRLRRFRVLGESTGHGHAITPFSMQYAPVTIPYRWRLSEQAEAQRRLPAEISLTS